MLEPLAPNLWVAEAPLRWLGVELGRRMTVIRLSGDELLVHSPAALTAELHDALGGVGEVRFVVPASRFHGHLYMEQYRAAYSKVELFAAPGLERRRTDSPSTATSARIPIPAGARMSTRWRFPAAAS